MPTISVIVPCYNEEETIGLLLDALVSQSFPRSELEVIIADGMSNDKTRVRVIEFTRLHPDLEIRIVDNPKRAIPTALNRAIEAAQGEYIVRMDAHSTPAPDYIERCLEALKARRGANVGGIWQIKPGRDTWIARAIAEAAAHPLGVGDALYRLGGRAGAVDTVPFGAFRRDLVEKIGPYDEKMLTNEDYEFNTRIRQAGETIWFDPQIRSIYFARTSLVALMQQYMRYGYWKAQMLRRYPKTLRWRQALPPAFVGCLVFLFLLSPWLLFARWLLFIQISLYSVALLAVGVQISIIKHDLRMLAGVPLAIATMHLSWGMALWWGLISIPRRISEEDNPQ
jgi:succinoglycan biosynthesis protein ExoA